MDAETNKVKKRRITTKDLDTVRDFIVDTLRERESSAVRKRHENVWREVDRQIQMEAPKVVNKQSAPGQDWHSVIQLGLLADASEVVTADVLRLVFPNDRTWFRPHVEIPMQLDPQTGMPERIERSTQRSTDVVLANLMAQQHSDFGLKERVALSLKEALHHGGFVAEVRWQVMPKFHDGSNVEAIGAPVWMPHSMWNCFPDPSAHIIGTEIFYPGAMVMRWMMPYERTQRMSKWKNKDKIPRPKQGGEVEIICFYGDLSIDRRDEVMFLPNRKVLVAGATIVYSEVNDTPYSPLLYGGYEREDVRDPYYTSPIVKRAPMSKLATRMANKFLDAVDLKTEPPIVYEKHDSFFAGKGGPQVFPGAKNPTSGAANFKVIETADPGYALEGMQFAIREVERGTAVDAIRSGVSPSTAQTATEVVKTDQKGEVRTVDFVGHFERQGLRPFLYMQHALNLKQLSTYTFYNTDPHTPDFMRLKKSDLPKHVHFEITGSREQLGEEQRVQRTREAHLMALSNEMTAQHVNVEEVLRNIYEDARVKDPERFIAGGEEGEDPAVAQAQAQIEEITAQAQEQIAQLQQALQQAQQEVEKGALLTERFNAERATMQSTLEQHQTDVNALREVLRIIQQQRQTESEIRAQQAKLEALREKMQREMQSNSEHDTQALRQASAAGEAQVKSLMQRLDGIESAREKRTAVILKELDKRGANGAVKRIEGTDSAGAMDYRES